MAWDDWVFGVATGGLYNVGKTAYKAGEAAEEAGDAVEEIADGAGSALAAVGSTITKLGKDMSSFMKELEELLSIDRLTPRDSDDLWDAEVERLEKLRQRETELLNELNQIGASDDDDSWMDSFWGSIFGGKQFEELQVRTKLAVVRKAIHEILYEEPGVIPTGLHNVQQILERFHTMEQPRIEDILESLDDNLNQSQDVLKEVEKLFVVRTWKKLQVIDLPQVQQRKLKELQQARNSYDVLIEKNSRVGSQIRDVMVEANPSQFQMAKFIGVKAEKQSGSDRSSGETSGGTPRTTLSGENRLNLDNLRISPDRLRKLNLSRQYLAKGPSLTLKGKISGLSLQPMAANVATALNQNSVSAYYHNYQMVSGRLKFFRREKLKVEKEIHRLQWVMEEEPGVIPKILGEV